MAFDAPVLLRVCSTYVDVLLCICFVVYFIVSFIGCTSEDAEILMPCFFPYILELIFLSNSYAS